MNPSDFIKEINGKKIQLYTLKNGNGIEILITNFGLKIISIKTLDKKGNFDDIVLGFTSVEEYLETNEVYFGAVIGRYGNRIAEGKLSIDEKEYRLEQNNGPNHLHGGTHGFHNVVWNTHVISDTEIVFDRISPDMEEGYPGNLSVSVTYLLTDDNKLKISYKATTDQTTVINLTHHSYFNLSGEGKGTINDHLLEINADKFTPVDHTLIPTGELVPVKNTPFDFRKPKPIGRDLKQNNEQLKFGYGYDHNFVLNTYPKDQEGLTFASKVIDPDSGRVLEVFTNEPGIQFYGGNWLNGNTTGKKGTPYLHQGAFCLETQHFPDSPNQPHFPKTLLQPGEVYQSTCVYKFGVIS